MQDVSRFFVDTCREVGFIGLCGLLFFEGPRSDLKECHWQKQRNDIPKGTCQDPFLGQLRNRLQNNLEAHQLVSGHDVVCPHLGSHLADTCDSM